MKIKIDLESDALYFRISHAPIVESEEVGSGLIGLRCQRQTGGD
jgi:uncharacterized protein YuzE